MTIQYKWLLLIISAILLTGCGEKNMVKVVPKEIQDLRNKHGGATNWLECHEGVIVNVITKYSNEDIMPRIIPLKQNGNYVRCNAEKVEIQAIEVSQDDWLQINTRRTIT